MAKLNRITAKIFGETASTTNTPKEIGQFGSAKAGTYNATGDVATIQSLPAWSNGWIDAVTPTDQFPPLPEMTGVHKVLSYQNAYLLQQGIPEWDSATTYYENGFCSYNGIIYKSLIDGNINNQPDEIPQAWFEYGSGDYANQDINNLTTFGNARLQYAPFAINAGTVINGNNHTLQSGSFIQSYTETGSYTIEITEAGNYEIEMYGAGGGGANGYFATDNLYCYTAAGGSGAGFKGVLNLAVGTYSITIGGAGSNAYSGGVGTGTSGGDTIFGNYIVTSGGGGAYSSGAQATNGQGGTVSIIDSSVIVSETLNSSGNAGAGRGTIGTGPVSATGGASVYDGTATGYGAGAGYPNNARDGYLKITKLTGDASKIFCDPCMITTVDGRTKIFDTASTIDVSSQPDGSYSIFKDYETGNLSLVDDFKISNIDPSTDYWLDTSTVPANLKVNGAINNDLVYIGNCTVNSGGVDAIINRDFNDSGYIVNRYSKAVITETYVNGSSWYRVYSDGWCEQGGLIIQNTTYTRTINLLKPYNNTNYICIVCAGGNTYTGSGYGYIGTRNTDSFQCVILDNAPINACWQASGYIA